MSEDGQMPLTHAMLEAEMSNEEIICAWMEPKPILTAQDHDQESGHSLLHWWCWRDVYGDPNPMQPKPRALSLNALWEVAKRLTDDQQWAYIEALRGVNNMPTWHFLHATPQQKIKALAEVIKQKGK